MRVTPDANASRKCQQCGTPFVPKRQAGQRQLHCSRECRVKYQVAQRQNLPRCSVDGCQHRVRSGRAVLCEKHYGRARRGVDLNDARPVSGRYVTAAGYIKLLRPDHPLADTHGHVFEHRVVVYDKNGGTEPSCFWCGKGLTWKQAVVDHLNEDKADNTPSNLVCSCNDCNRARGALVPFVRRMRADAIETFVRAMHLMRA